MLCFHNFLGKHGNTRNFRGNYPARAADRPVGDIRPGAWSRLTLSTIRKIKKRFLLVTLLVVLLVALLAVALLVVALVMLIVFLRCVFCVAYVVAHMRDYSCV